MSNAPDYSMVVLNAHTDALNPAAWQAVLDMAPDDRVRLAATFCRDRAAAGANPLTDAAQDDLAALAAQLPELPVARFARLTGAGLPEATALLLATEPELAAYYDDLVDRVGDPKVAANWVMGEFQAHLNADGIAAGSSTSAAKTSFAEVWLIVPSTTSATRPATSRRSAAPTSSARSSTRCSRRIPTRSRPSRAVASR